MTLFSFFYSCWSCIVKWGLLEALSFCLVEFRVLATVHRVSASISTSRWKWCERWTLSMNIVRSRFQRFMKTRWWRKIRRRQENAPFSQSIVSSILSLCWFFYVRWWLLLYLPWFMVQLTKLSMMLMSIKMFFVLLSFVQMNDFSLILLANLSEAAAQLT